MDSEGKILIVEDNEHSRELACDVLADAGYQVAQADSGEQCLDMLSEFHPDVVLLDRGLPGISGDQVISKIRSDPDYSDTKVIFISARSDITERVDGLTMGADDYLPKPYDLNELTARVETQLRTKSAEDALKKAYQEVDQQVRNRTKELTRANDRLKDEILERKRAESALKKALDEVESLRKQLEEENIYLKDEIKSEHNFDNIIGQSEAISNVLQLISQVAATDATVILLGESGTGKELFARAIHGSSDRSKKPLVKLNCAALPGTLIESELFGHEKGAFTGAVEKRIGRFELADKGTIFLDEIGDLPLDLQAKLLRVLQEGEFERLGSSHTKRVNVRVIAATNRNLSQALESGAFREDLYYRLSVFPIVIPPLRERLGDVSILANYFLVKYAAKIGKPITSIPDHVLSYLQSYYWPGNVRELENVIERAVILTQGEVLEVQQELETRSVSAAGPPDGLEAIKDQERQLLIRTLEKCNWVIGGEMGAASVLNLAPSTLRERMQKFAIQRSKRRDG